MKARITGLMAVPLALMLFGSGCNTTEQGMGLGSLLGAGLGQLIGGDTKGTLIGAAVGAAVGTAAGSAVNNQQKQFAAREKELNLQIGSVKTKIAAARTVNGRLTTQVAGLKQQISFLDQKRNRTVAETNRLRQLVASAKTQTGTAQSQLATVETELRNARNVSARHGGSPQAKALNQQIAALEKERSQLRQTITQLAGLNAPTL